MKVLYTEFLRLNPLNGGVFEEKKKSGWPQIITFFVSHWGKLFGIGMFTTLRRRKTSNIFFKEKKKKICDSESKLLKIFLIIQNSDKMSKLEVL